MRYRDMRTLFADLAGDGRLTVHLAFRDAYPSPWTSEPSASPWTVVLRDNATIPLPGADVRYLYRIADPVQVDRLGEGTVSDGLCLLDSEADAACRLTWPQVLRVLDCVAESYPRWQIEAVVGTLEPEPRYSVTLRTEQDSPHPIADAPAFDRLCLATGPLGPHGPLSGVVMAGARQSSWDVLPALGVAVPSGAHDPFTALVFAPARRPRSCTLGGLTWLAQPSACVWLDLCAPSRNEVLAMARQLCLPYSAVLATLAPASQSWCHAHHDYISVRMPVPLRESASGQIRCEPLDLIVGPEVVVSIHAKPLTALARVRRHVGAGPDHVAMTAPALVDAILGAVLSSDESLARWVAHDGAQALRPAVRVNAAQIDQNARTLQYVVEAQQALLSDADRLARHLQGLALISWWDEAEDRRRRLHDTLRQVERLGRDDIACPGNVAPKAVSSQLAGPCGAHALRASARRVLIGTALVLVLTLIVFALSRYLY